MESNAPISAENLRQILHGNKINVRRIETVSGPSSAVSSSQMHEGKWSCQS